MAVLEALFAIPALILLALAIFFAVEALGALLPPRRAPAAPARRIAVVVPAHNEAAHIAPTLADIKTQLRPEDRLIVVADNCEDDTAEVAMRAGAACLIRDEPEQRGKGYALQFALDKLRDDPPETVVFVDADCRLEEGALMRLAGAAAASGRPVQGLYLMRAGEDAPPARRVAAFAWLVLNQARMQGLSTLFDVCRMTGSGMALPWRIASEIDLATPEIVEDLALTAKLVGEDAPPLFCPEARIRSNFPDTDDAAAAQHARWEHGSMKLALRRAPAMLVEAAGEADIRRAATALDLMIPPLTIFAAALAAMLVVGAVLAMLGADLPLELTAGAAGIFFLALLAVWLVFGMETLPPHAFGAVFAYLGEKLKVHGEKARESTKSWTRTERDAGGAHDG